MEYGDHHYDLIANENESQILKMRELSEIKFNEWLNNNPNAIFDDIPPELHSIFIPPSAYKLSTNPSTVETKIVPRGAPIYFAAVSESTNSSEEQERLRTTYQELYDSNTLGDTENILLMSHLFVWDNESNVLYVNNYDGQAHAGIATEFYGDILPTIAKKMNLRFIVGQNDPDNISFFTSPEGLNRVTRKQIKPEYREKFFPNIDKNDTDSKTLDLATIQFLYEEDRVIYLE